MEKVYRLLPNFLQNILVTVFDWNQYRKRHGGRYKYWLDFFSESRKLSLRELEEKQSTFLKSFLEFARDNSDYYKKILVSENRLSCSDINYSRLPIQSKEDIRSNIEDIYTISASRAILSKTGGTTGKSLEVRFTKDDMQNRFALLDLFRMESGYVLGKKVAWFSGKSLLTPRDKRKNRYWKTDFLYNIRYYSTFHINTNTAKYYIDNLNKYRPLYAVGFPSSMMEIAKWGLSNNYMLDYSMTALFPTAETVTDIERETLKCFFGGQVLNQYASSEGAPFILECSKGKLHLELLSGVFEVLDDDNKPTDEGKLVFTSFTTHGTPLIRYNINDRIKISQDQCECGNNNPTVKEIQGRVNDFVFSRQNGKINLGNISNCVKYVKGIVKFQIVQLEEDSISVLIKKDMTYSNADEEKFLYELKERLGDEIVINLTYVDEIENEASGKYRIVKQHLSM